MYADDTTPATTRDQLRTAVDRLQVIRYDPPSVSLFSVLALVLAVAATAFAGVWWVKRERDAYWRERIAHSSASVRAIISNGGTLANTTDAEIIKGLENDDREYQAARARLAQAASRPAQTGPVRDACRVPVECLR